MHQDAVSVHPLEPLFEIVIQRIGIDERLAKVRDLGCEYAICYFPEAAYDRSGIELFEREVIPALS